jgi:Major Facilitator Superfamily
MAMIPGRAQDRVFLGGQAVSMIGDGLAVLAIPLLVLRLTSSPVAAVLAALPGSAGYLAAGLPAGVLADRLSPWLVLAAGDLTQALIFVLLFALTAAGLAATPAWLILVLAGAAGVVTVFSDTALDILVRDLFTGTGLVSANSWLESANQAGLIIGPSVTGLLAAAGLLHVSLLIDAATFVISLASLAGLRGRYRAARYQAGHAPGRASVAWRALRHEVAEGIRYLAATRLLATLLVFMLVLNLCLGADKLIIFLVRDTLRLPPGQIGLVAAAGGAGGLVGAASTTLLCRRLGALSVITLCCASSGLALLLISAATTMPLALAGNLFYTWAIIAASVTMRALRQAVVPRRLLGRVTAAWRLGGQGVTLAGGVLAGAAAALLGNDPRPVFAAAGTVTLVTVATAWFVALRHEDAGPRALFPRGR